MLLFKTLAEVGVTCNAPLELIVVIEVTIFMCFLCIQLALLTCTVHWHWGVCRKSCMHRFGMCKSLHFGSVQAQVLHVCSYCTCENFASHSEKYAIENMFLHFWRHYSSTCIIIHVHVLYNKKKFSSQTWQECTCMLCSNLDGSKRIGLTKTRSRLNYWIF